MSLLGVDIGTSGCRAAAFAADGRRLAAATEAYAVEHGPGARAVQDVDAVWAAVEACIREVNAAVGRTDPVEALAFATQGEAVVAVDDAGRAHGPAPLSFDYRATAETAALLEAVEHDRFRTITGMTAHPMFTIFKIAWWLRHEPSGAGAAYRFHCYGDLAALRLGVEPAIDYTLAARTGMLDVAARQWSPELLAAIGVETARLAAPVPCGSPLGPIAGDKATALGFTAPPLLVAGAHDQAAAAWGAGVRRDGDAHLSLGTTDCLTVAVSDAPRYLERSVYPYSPYDDGDTWLVLAGLPSGGSALAWFVRELGPDLHTHDGRSPYDVLYESMAEDSGDVVVLPHFAGSGTHDDDASSTAAIVGLSLTSTRAQVARALVESSGFETARNITALQAAGVRVADIRVGGGGARNDRGLLIRAEALGRSLVTPPTPSDVTCRGAALLAAVGLGQFPSIEAAAATVPGATVVSPSPERVEALARRRQTYAQLYPALRSVRNHLHPEPEHRQETPHGHHP